MNRRELMKDVGIATGAASLLAVGAEFQKTITAEIEKLRQMLEGQDGAPATVEEPMLPVPAERFLTEPVHAR